MSKPLQRVLPNVHTKEGARGSRTEASIHARVRMAPALQSGISYIMEQRARHQKGEFIADCQSCKLLVTPFRVRRVGTITNFGDAQFLIMGGKVSVQVDTVGITDMGCGEVFGEDVLLEASSRYASTVQARGLVCAFTLDRKHLLQVFAEFPEEPARFKSSREQTEVDEMQLVRATMMRVTVQRIRAKLALLKKNPRQQLVPSPPNSSLNEDTVSDCSSNESVMDRRTSKFNLRATGKECCREWAARRQKAMTLASQRKEALAAGARGVFLRPLQGYRTSQIGLGTAFAEPGEVVRASGRASRLSMLRLKKAERIYKRPVWCEVLGAPIAIN